MPPESSRLGVVGRPSHERARGPRNLGRFPIHDPRDGILDGGLGGRAASSNGEREHPERRGPPTRAGVHQTFRTSVPARGLFIPADAGPTCINQRELLAAIFGLKMFLPVARQQRVQLLSDSQVALAVTRNWTCRSPRVMVLLRIMRRICEENGISLGLQYIPSVLNIWADKLSRSRPSSNWALIPSSLAQIRTHLPHQVNIFFFSEVLKSHKR
jgi:hypothetical protein